MCSSDLVKLSDLNELDWSEEIVYTAAGPTRSMAPRPKETTKEIPLPDVTGDWSEFYLNIIDVLAGKAEQKVTHKQMLRVMDVIDAVFESERTGASVKKEI